MGDITEILRHDAALVASSHGIDMQAARMEVQMLLQHVLHAPRAWLLAHPEHQMDAADSAIYRTLLQRRLAGEPVAYILGEREFFGLSLKVTPDTLIPRPETELLVELALQWIPPLGGFRVLDLGTGTGAIAISIAHARPEAEVIGVDASPAALEMARENARRLCTSNVSFAQSDWFSALGEQRFDLIVANPPYIAAGDTHLTQGDVRFEPLSALVSGADGLDDIRRIIHQAGQYLETGGWLLLEHGYDQAARVRDLLGEAGFGKIFSEKDLSGIERASGGTR